jgi:hypothetical protein
MDLSVATTPQGPNSSTPLSVQPLVNPSSTTASAVNGVAQGNINQAPAPAQTIPQAQGSPMNDLLTHVQSNPVTPPAPTYNLMNGAVSIDANGNYVQNTDQINSKLNSAQTQTFGSLGNTKDTDKLASQANDMITEAMGNKQQDLTDIGNAQTAAANIPNLVQQNYYDALNQTGLTDAQNGVLSAMQDYNNAQLAEAKNVPNIQAGQATGGYTTQNEGQSMAGQNAIALGINKLAAGLKLQVAQQALNNKTDMFKTLDSALNSGDQFAVDKQVALISQRTGIDQNELSAGVNLLNQVRQENQNNETQTRQWMQMFAMQFPGFYSQLTPEDQQAISNGQITPSILGLMGKVATTAGTKLGIQQQQANTQSAAAISTEMTNIMKAYQTAGGDVNSPAFASYLNSQMAQFTSLQGASTNAGVNGGAQSSDNTVSTSTGASYYTGQYNSNPGYASSLQNTINNISQSADTSTPQGIDSYLQQTAPNTSLTGDMISQTAQTYGVEPAALLGFMQKESNLGTSAVAQQDNNFGGITWTQSYQDSHPGVTKGTPRPAGEGGNYVMFATPQDGLNAQAEQLSKMSQSGGQGGQQSGGLFGGTNTQGADNFAGIPVQNTNPASNTGAKYIDLTALSKTDPQYKGALSFAQANGVFPVTDTTELKSLQGIAQARATITKMTNDASQYGVFSNAMGIFGEIGQNLKQLEKSPGSSGTNQRQWNMHGAQLMQAIKDITGNPRVINNGLDNSQFPSTTSSSPTDAKNWLDTMTQALNDAEKSIVGKYAPKSTPQSATGLYLQNNFGGVPIQ